MSRSFLLQNSINLGYSPDLAGLRPLRNLKPIQLKALAAVNGFGDFYTVPSKRKLLVVPGFQAYNPTGAGINVSLQAKIGGSYKQLSALTAVLSLTGSPVEILGGFGYGIVLNEGESISYSTSAQNLNLNGLGMEFDSSVSLISPRIFTSLSGDNVLYTCPTNKLAVPSLVPATAGGSVFTPRQINVLNTSIGAITYSVHLVSTGQVANDSNLIDKASVGAGVAAGLKFGGSLVGGDSIVVKAGSNGGSIWGLIWEVNA
jgi:hypothetical protein